MRICNSVASRSSVFQQRGLSSLGWLVVLAVVGFFLTTLLKLGPLYLDNYFVAAAVESLKSEDIHNLDSIGIRRKLDNQFIVNNVRDIDPASISVVREKTRTLVNVDYERRVPFMGNVDVVVKFTNQYDSSQGP